LGGSAGMVIRAAIASEIRTAIVGQIIYASRSPEE
jgi:hypothetical protein